MKNNHNSTPMFLAATAACLLSFVVSPSAHAVVLYDNLLPDEYLADPPFRVFIGNGFVGQPYGTWEAQPFLTGNEPVSLTAVTFQLGGALAVNDSRTFDLTLYSDAPDGFPGPYIPDAVLAQLWVGSVLAAGIPHVGDTSAYGQVVFGGLNQALAANTIYWLALRGSDEEMPPLFDVLLGGYVGGIYQGNPVLLGESASADPLLIGTSWTPSGGGGMAAKIEATPEPGSAALLLGGGALLALRRRKSTDSH